MTSSILLCNNSTSLIDQWYLSTSCDMSMTRGGLMTQHNTVLVIFHYNCNYDQTSGIMWWKKKVHDASAVALGSIFIGIKPARVY